MGTVDWKQLLGSLSTIMALGVNYSKFARLYGITLFETVFGHAYPWQPPPTTLYQYVVFGYSSISSSLSTAHFLRRR